MPMAVVDCVIKTITSNLVALVASVACFYMDKCIVSCRPLCSCLLYHHKGIAWLWFQLSGLGVPTVVVNSVKRTVTSNLVALVAFVACHDVDKCIVFYRSLCSCLLYHHKGIAWLWFQLSRLGVPTVVVNSVKRTVTSNLVALVAIVACHDVDKCIVFYRSLCSCLL